MVVLPLLIGSVEKASHYDVIASVTRIPYSRAANPHIPLDLLHS